MTGLAYWPGTGVVKSLHTDFNWRSTPGQVTIAMQLYERKAAAGLQGAAKTTQILYGAAADQPPVTESPHVTSTQS